MGLRLVAGRPVSAVTMECVASGSAPRAAHGCPAWRVSWAPASGPRSAAGRHEVRQHKQQGKRGADGGRGVVCSLPSKSPWRNPIEPQGVAGKRAGAAPDRLLSAEEWAARVYAYERCDPEAHLAMPNKVA